MTVQQAIDYKRKRNSFNVGICYFHDSELRTAYYRAKTVEEAIEHFRKDTNDEILNVWLFDEGDIEEC